MRDERPFEWPDDTQDATRLGVDWRLHALPAWATRNLRGVAYGFREAAETAYEAAVERKRPVDAMFLPLAYLWRHHIELMLKANIEIWSAFNESPTPRFGGKGGLGHDLGKLWDKFDELSSPHVGPEDLASAAAGRRALVSFLRLEPHPDSSRYPADVQRRPYQRPERVDLRELHRTATAVSALLSGAYDQVDAWLQEGQ